ncbi:unnamed protein product [Cercopithifilaria johnstoni]|uniref:C2H2-type domain-containing protein n=1 Tax=Cercopithifilaria johnstoni TaxID=2874296 RepID=A0A8J2M3R0_9BILA|nr:unnamed protein product [Cercopithifilaria johnstoni]CAG9539298.1 unnamed protein product [Cercopithifilaria johnstoni]
MHFNLSLTEVSEERMELPDSLIEEAIKEQLVSLNVAIHGANAEQNLQNAVSPKKIWMKRHIVDQTNENLRGCSECNKTTSQSSDLQKNLVNRTGEKPQTHMVAHIVKETESPNILVQRPNAEQEGHPASQAGKKSHDCFKCHHCSYANKIIYQFAFNNWALYHI